VKAKVEKKQDYLHIKISPEVKRKLERAARENDRTITAVVRRLIVEHL
jgi:predicted transcriptional regulator